MPSRGRLLRIGTGRHAKQFGDGAPIKSLKDTLYPNDSDSDPDDDGTVDPSLWADSFTASQCDDSLGSYIRKTSREVQNQFGISDDESDDSMDGNLPLVSDILMRPYMINQVMCATSAREADILDIMEVRSAEGGFYDVRNGMALAANTSDHFSSQTSTTNTSLFDPPRRYLATSSVDLRDMHGRKITYAPNGDDGRAYRRSMGKWVLSCRNMLVNYHNQGNLSEQEKIAVARGNFCLIVLRRWYAIASKMAQFRRIILR